MQAIRIDKPSSPTDSTTPYSASNPAPPSALVVDNTIPIPQLARPGDILVRVQAATVTRDELTWPETYRHKPEILGFDYSGTVTEVCSSQEDTPTADSGERVVDETAAIKLGDEVFGMKNTSHRGGTWAEYTVVRREEVARKPKRLDFAHAATLPMSALTAWQALFVQVGVAPPDLSTEQTRQRATAGSDKESQSRTKALFTGASGAVGAYLVQLGALAGLHVTAASTSNERNGEFLKSLGATEVVEYVQLEDASAKFDVVIDTVGGSTLEKGWRWVKDNGTLVTVDSASFSFVERHRQESFTRGKENVKAVFFIVEPSQNQLEQLAVAVDLGLVQAFVAQTLPLIEARRAYEIASGRTARRGKVVLTL